MSPADAAPTEPSRSIYTLGMERVRVPGSAAADNRYDSYRYYDQRCYDRLCYDRRYYAVGKAEHSTSYTGGRPKGQGSAALTQRYSRSRYWRSRLMR